MSRRFVQLINESLPKVLKFACHGSVDFSFSYDAKLLLPVALSFFLGTRGHFRRTSVFGSYATGTEQLLPLFWLR